MTLQERDKKHLWHPLTQHKIHPNTIAITKAKGALLYDENENTYIDAIASWYTSIHGHCNPFISTKISAQLNTLDHVIFSGFTHRPAVELSEALIAILPKNQNKLFFSDNGSTTVEVAIKMAFQYYFNKGIIKNTLIAFDEAFHGDTFGAMSVSGLSVYNGPFEDFFLNVIRIPLPNETNISAILTQLETLNNTEKIAAFIYEPLVLGAAGMKMYDAKYLEPILKFCDTHEIIKIADEVMTGFGKTGTTFASLQINILPDIMCLSKALTGGALPMGITSCTQQIYAGFYSDKMAHGFFHGHTYSANPLACTAALASIELLTQAITQENIARIMALNQAFAKHIKTHHKVKLVRQTGVILALDLNIEMERYGNLRDKLFLFFMENGVFLRPLGNTIYIQPPYIITDTELQTVYTVIENALNII